MPTTLVTGASGFIGWHIARQLLDRGDCVRALCRPSSQLRDLEVERVTGDLCNPASLRAAVAGCDLVFHVAADYRLWSRDPRELYRTNVEGTRNLLAAAAEAGVARVVYTSTVGCIGIPKDGVGDEDTPVSIDDMTGDYKRSKWLAEQIALRKAREGQSIVIVNPTAPVGDHDWKPTPTGKIILDFVKGRLPAFVDTGLNLIDVRDTAAGHLLAAEKGLSGERYILGSQNMTLQAILGKLALLTGKPAPTRELPYALALAAGVISTAWANLTGKHPAAPLEAVKMANKKMFASPAKAIRELGFSPRPVDAALSRAVEWFSSNGYR